MPTPPEPATGRRAFLRLAALAPLAPLAAGCAASVRVGPRPQPAAGPSAPPAAPDAVEVVRAFALPPEAEPASLFRAVVPRGRGTT